ncbi:diguanylate cyclase/phosphodiesterase (GGDEF / EAL domains) with PAS/PAC sensor(s) [Desulfurella amilsii]|uniref:Diguanylate cyclase/phosphodiesterase (GGDEF / EAL domains) with PAS/PAC sensor(S) n=1 Tax=Desulfurella amilsii TaxID=1562698 RepID=A0A1X4XUZ5_9BACT|nr:EAL domain-containing protein [Desulfurella amilsii]OSS41359.1 diguanylate cyclase/phosphodiesterase (GGDEF / EAL domains) with PAS/PAC sensor(s) [Desulfurella amilsii]
MNKTKNNLYEIVYKSYEILIKDFQNINFDLLLDLAFNYLDVELVWVGILSDGNLKVSNAKGEAIGYINDKSLRSYQQSLLKSYLDSFFVSNDILRDERLFYLKDNAKIYNFNSVFFFSFKINNSDYGFIVFYSKNKDYFDKRTVEILSNFALAVKTVLLLQEKEKKHSLLTDIVENSYQGIVIANNQNKIIYTNKAFAKITGYSFEEAKNKNPSILKSNYHSIEYYKDMWYKIVHEGHFEGKIYNKKKNGEVYEEIIFIKTIKDKEGKILYYFSFFTDLTELKKAQDQANYYTYHDPVTKLINQTGFFEQAQGIIENNESFALVYLDLDDFSIINVNFGIEKANSILRAFGDFLRKEIARPKDIVGRLGSDEFVILKRSVIDQTIIKFTQNAAEKIRQKVFLVDNQEVFLKVSAGIVLYPKDSDDINTLVNYAQASCKKAKQLGKNQCVFFNNSIYEEFINSFALTNEILHGIEFEEFELYFQPIYNTHSRTITNAEALIRWNHPKRGLLSPFSFIPFAEQSYIIEKLDFYVLEKAFQAIKSFKQENLNIILSVNLTGRTFLMDNFVDQFRKLLSAYAIDTSFIKIELTESIALNDENKARNHMDALNSLGINFSMDDFGTGYSSILSLKKFPFSNIKLDQNFVMDSQNNKDSEIINSNLLNMLNELNFETTAEGVENEFLFFLFNYLPCDLLQGYFISKPVDYKRFVSFVKNFTPDIAFMEFKKDNTRMHNLQMVKVKFYIYKYYKKLREFIQNKPTDQQMNNLSNIIELDYKHCDFGKWYYSVYPIYNQIETFKSIEVLHIDLHKTTEKLLLEKDKEKIQALILDLKYKIMLLNAQFENFYLETVKILKI